MDGNEASVTVSALCTVCLKSLNDLVTSLVVLDKNYQGTAEDSRGRFRIWAADVGALLPSTSEKSLDAQVREARRIKGTVFTGLRRIERCSEAGVYEAER